MLLDFNPIAVTLRKGNVEVHNIAKQIVYLRGGIG